MVIDPNYYSRARVLCVAAILIVVVLLVYLFPRSQSALAKNVIPSTVNAITVNSTADIADGTDGLCTLR